MKVMIVKELMTGDVSPVAMFLVYLQFNCFNFFRAIVLANSEDMVAGGLDY